MITVNPLEVEGMFFTAVTVELPKTNLLIISNETGYIMCGALDVDIFNEPALKGRNVIAARAVGVRTIDDLLHAPLQKVTDASKEKYGWESGMTGKDALLKIA